MGVKIVSLALIIGLSGECLPGSYSEPYSDCAPSSESDFPSYYSSDYDEVNMACNFESIKH